MKDIMSTYGSSWLDPTQPNLLRRVILGVNDGTSPENTAIDERVLAAKVICTYVQTRQVIGSESTTKDIRAEITRTEILYTHRALSFLVSAMCTS